MGAAGLPADEAFFAGVVGVAGVGGAELARDAACSGARRVLRKRRATKAGCEPAYYEKETSRLEWATYGVD